MTDGQAARNYDDLIQRMKIAGITLSAVGIEDYDPHLKVVAPETGGRFYAVHDLNDVPRLFFDEALRAARRGIVEKAFTPVIAFPAPAVRDFEAAPPLHGYNAVTPKASAQVILQSDTGDPILAQWQYGLGRVAAWTSDMKGQWAREWVQWDGFGRFAGQLVTDLLPASNTEGFTASTRIEGSALVLDVQSETTGRQGQSGLQITGRLIKADSSIQEISLNEVEPGRYRGTTALPEAGVYRVQVLVEDTAGQSLGIVSTGAVVPPSAEYLQRDGNTALLNALAQRTSGRTDIAPEQVWEALPAAIYRPQLATWALLWLAALLWPIDIAVRRLLLPQPRIAAAWLSHTRPAHVRQPAPVALNLQRARAHLAQRTKQARSAAEDQPGTSGSISASSNAIPAASAIDTQHDRHTTPRGVVKQPSKQPPDKHGTI